VDNFALEAFLDIVIIGHGPASEDLSQSYPQALKNFQEVDFYVDKRWINQGWMVDNSSVNKIHQSVCG
jgi:hypothetical protein